MKKTSLFEAAAELLKQSHSSAPKEEMHKAPVEVQDLGGTTPTENVDKPLDPNAEKAHYPGTQPSGDTKAPLEKVEGGATVIDPLEQGTNVEGEAAERKRRIEAGLSQGDLRENAEEWKAQLKEDVAKILANETNLPKEFTEKVATIYEARVTDKVSSITESIISKYDEEFKNAIVEIKEELSAQVNDILNYVVEQWMQENELAIEKGIRAELTEEFIGGLRELFMEHYIDIPADKVDVVDELAAKVEELEGKLNEEISRGVDLSKKLMESKKQEVIKSVCEGLTQTQTEKVRTLAEGVEFTAEGDYAQRVATIRENYFPAEQPKKLDTKVLTEASEPIAEEKKSGSVDPEVSAVAKAISQFIK